MIPIPESAFTLIASLEPHNRFTIVPIRGGGNNRVFRVDINDMPRYLLKEYFRHPSDSRDRLHAEYSFLRYAAELNISCVPRPIIESPSAGIACYEYIQGRKVTVKDINENSIQQAITFFREINRLDSPFIIGNASEACFSLEEHICAASRRIERILNLSPVSPIERKAASFVCNDLKSTWERVINFVNSFFPVSMGSYTISEGEKRISPSDFGFHNAILNYDGAVIFVDFEYAGFDDPVKMICDFFCQPAVPVPISNIRHFAEQVLEGIPGSTFHYRRMLHLMPVHMIKWCGILMNEFTPDGQKRRLFADDTKDLTSSQKEQLKKAQTMCIAAERWISDCNQL